MHNAPLISVVLPVWNGERYLSDAIESVLAQTEPDFELIIVNDCSTDSSALIAENFARMDTRVRIVHNDVNLRLPAALNRGFGLARGRYFSWTSDDNILHPAFLETLLGNLTKNSADVVYSDFNSIDENGNSLSVSAVGDAEGLVACNTIGASFLYKREVHEVLGGYDTEKFLYEDYDFWVRAFIAGFKFMPLHTVVYDYRRHPASLTSARTVPDTYAFYRYELRKRFKGVARRHAFSAREILIGYRPVLGLRRWAILVAEAAWFSPSGALRIITRIVGKIPLRIGLWIRRKMTPSHEA